MEKKKDAIKRYEIMSKLILNKKDIALWST